MKRRKFATLASAAFLVVLPALAVCFGADAEHVDGHADHGGHPPYLLSSTIWAIGSFLVVLAILTKVLFPPILKAMDQRAAEIRDALDAAAKAKLEAEEMMSRHKADLDKARAEGAEIVEEAKSDANKLKESIVTSARQEAEAITARSVREIEQAKTAAVDVLQRQAAAISLDIASKLIQKNLQLDDHKQLIDEKLRGFRDFGQVN